MNSILIFTIVFFIISEPSSSFSTINPDDVELVFVQTLWRHGDRAALDGWYPIFEDDWVFGGGGYGELTPLGMAQMNRLGALLRQRYMSNETRFLSERYNKKEIYIRSTDLNRTIVSAVSFLYGFYPPGSWNIKGVDYPDIPGWPSPVAFIPVHVDQIDNCVTNAVCKCQRYSDLRKMMNDLPEWKDVKNQSAPFLASVAKIYNYTSTTASNNTFNVFPDSLKCIKQHFNSTLYETSPWFNDQFYIKSQTCMSRLKQMIEGKFENDPTVHGINIATEVRVLQGGALLNELYDRAVQKLECSRSNCTGYLEKLKFYAYSSHDQNLYVLLVIFGIPEITDTLDSWPEVSASILFEFYKSRSTNVDYFKLMYRKSDGSNFDAVTQMVAGCEGQELCPMGVLRDLAEKYKPVPDIVTLCDQRITTGSGTSISVKLSIIVVLLSVFHQL